MRRSNRRACCTTTTGAVGRREDGVLRVQRIGPRAGSPQIAVGDGAGVAGDFLDRRVLAPRTTGIADRHGRQPSRPDHVHRHAADQRRATPADQHRAPEAVLADNRRHSRQLPRRYALRATRQAAIADRLGSSRASRDYPVCRLIAPQPEIPAGAAWNGERPYSINPGAPSRRGLRARRAGRRSSQLRALARPCVTVELSDLLCSPGIGAIAGARQVCDQRRWRIDLGWPRAARERPRIPPPGS